MPCWRTRRQGVVHGVLEDLAAQLGMQAVPLLILDAQHDLRVVVVAGEG